MTTGPKLKSRVLHWKTILLISAMGNIFIGGLVAHSCVRNALLNKAWNDWAAAGFFFIYIFLNVFSLINLFFLEKLVIHLFLMIIYGFDAVLLGLFGYIVRDDLANLFRKPLSEIFTSLILIATFVLSVFSVFVLMWKLEKNEKDDA